MRKPISDTEGEAINLVLHLMFCPDLSQNCARCELARQKLIEGAVKAVDKVMGEYDA